MRKLQLTFNVLTIILLILLSFVNFYAFFDFENTIYIIFFFIIELGAVIIVFLMIWQIMSIEDIIRKMGYRQISNETLKLLEDNAFTFDMKQKIYRTKKSVKQKDEPLL